MQSVNRDEDAALPVPEVARDDEEDLEQGLLGDSADVDVQPSSWRSIIAGFASGSRARQAPQEDRNR